MPSAIEAATEYRQIVNVRFIKQRSPFHFTSEALPSRNLRASQLMTSTHTSTRPKQAQGQKQGAGAYKPPCGEITVRSPREIPSRCGSPSYKRKACYGLARISPGISSPEPHLIPQTLLRVNGRFHMAGNEGDGERDLDSNRSFPRHASQDIINELRRRSGPRSVGSQS